MTGKKLMLDGSRVRDGQSRHRFPDKISERLIVALDVPYERAIELVDQLHGVAVAFKVGFQLWTAQGSDALISKIIKEDRRVFLDAKMYDISNTIEQAVRTAGERGFSYVTVHHNEQVVKAAVAGRGDYNLKIFVVTLLTSLDNENLKDMGINKTKNELIEWNTKRALDFGCDGVIASAADDLRGIREIAKERGKDLLIATPGIRRVGASAHEHRRFSEPAQAIRAGADYLIVGRPIYDADDPKAAAKEIIEEMDMAFWSANQPAD
jgi:orotidine-5'-phosphate decarboxylase